MENIMTKHSEDYKNGYAQALKDINTFKLVIQEKWNPSQCPTCKEYFDEYKPCNDGYYKRAFNLLRCPYCGQAIYWDEEELKRWKKFYPERFKYLGK